MCPPTSPLKFTFLFYFITVNNISQSIFMYQDKNYYFFLGSKKKIHGKFIVNISCWPTSCIFFSYSFMLHQTYLFSHPINQRITTVYCGPINKERPRWFNDVPDWKPIQDRARNQPPSLTYPVKTMDKVTIVFKIILK